MQAAKILREYPEFAEWLVLACPKEAISTLFKMYEAGLSPLEAKTTVFEYMEELK